MSKNPETGYASMDHTFVDRFSGKEVSYTFRFSRPSRTLLDRVQKTMIQKKANLAMLTLCKETIHEEDREKFQEAVETYPGLPGTFGEAILDSCGFGQLGN